MTDRPSPYEAPELYDLLFDTLDFDLPFWLSVGRGARGPVLDLGCGTGRILLPLLKAGVDADGVDLNKPMLDRARSKAAAEGFQPRLVIADMCEFSMPRRYTRIISGFNAFAHADSTERQIATLRRCHEHLEPGGAFVIQMSYPAPGYWAEPDGVPAMEIETRRLEDGHRFQMWDARFKDVVGQGQRSEIEIREIDETGAVVKVSCYQTSQRWVYRYELELLFRLSGFARWEFFGGFEREPLEKADQQMIAWAWKSERPDADRPAGRSSGPRT